MLTLTLAWLVLQSILLLCIVVQWMGRYPRDFPHCIHDNDFPVSLFPLIPLFRWTPPSDHKWNVYGTKETPPPAARIHDTLSSLRIEVLSVQTVLFYLTLLYCGRYSSSYVVSYVFSACLLSWSVVFITLKTACYNFPRLVHGILPPPFFFAELLCFILFYCVVKGVIRIPGRANAVRMTPPPPPAFHRICLIFWTVDVTVRNRGTTSSSAAPLFWIPLRRTYKGPCLRWPA